MSRRLFHLTATRPIRNDLCKGKRMAPRYSVTEIEKQLKRIEDKLASVEAQFNDVVDQRDEMHKRLDRRLRERGKD